MTVIDALDRLPDFLREELASTVQPPAWHPEGAVIEHIKLVWKHLEDHGASEDLKIAAIFHDMGKISKTKTRPDDGRVIAYGHEMLADKFIDTFGILFPEVKDWEMVRFVCRFHMIMHRIGDMRPCKREPLEISPFWDDLVLFAKCDCMGRPSEWEA